MENEVDKNAKIIWNYMLMKHELKPADAIFALGSNDINVAVRASQLYKEGLASLVICSGGNGKDSRFLKTEAETYQEKLIQEGVPEEKIILEKKATNTGENILFTKRLLEEKDLVFRSFILVQKPYMERRTYATFKKQWPGVECVVTSMPVTYEEYSKDSYSISSKSGFINTMVGDLLRIKEYPTKGFQIPQEIPTQVWQAYENLVSLGYTKYTSLN